MKKVIKTLVFALVCMGVGGAVVALIFRDTIPSEWYQLAAAQKMPTVKQGSVVENTAVPTSYEAPVFDDSDLPVLERISASGRAKFISRGYEDSFASIGYVMDVATKPLDKKYVPDKYKHIEDMKSSGGRLQVLSIEEAVYEVNFEFNLLDSDGFVLMRVVSTDHNISSGTSVRVRAETEKLIPARVALLTKKICYGISVKKCLTSR
jgi:hypothetical protein